jgi:ketosteroid isomerase-like protein
MSRFLSLLAVSAIVSAASAHAQAAPASKPDTAAVRAALNAQTDKLTAAYLAGDAVTVAGLFTDDARAEYAGFPSAVGRAQIQSTYETYFKANKLKVAKSDILVVESVTADLATAGGVFHSFGNGKPAHAWWRWSAAYRKGADGQYRIAYIMAFPDSTK